MIKAIETVYKGYRFRSRLEARWAVFFDEVGIDWQYEVEGFEFDNQRYLPDFWLPKADMWIEIKPNNEQVPFEYLNKLGLFSEEIKKPLIVLYGQPYQKQFDLTIFPASIVEWIYGITSFSFAGFAIIAAEMVQDEAGVLCLCLQKEKGEVVGFLRMGKIPHLTGISSPTEADRIIWKAYEAARQARFGQNGRG